MYPIQNVKVLSKIFLHIGSNLGERRFHLSRAIQHIDTVIGPIQGTSAIYETEAWGYENQGAFLNMALEIEYYGTPIKLLDSIQKIEIDLGRKRTLHWGPRIIDIDIIMYDDIVIDTERLKIPHVELHNRNFVLFPMAEIASELVHPRLNKTMQELLDDCNDSSYVTIINPELIS